MIQQMQYKRNIIRSYESDVLSPLYKAGHTLIKYADIVFEGRTLPLVAFHSSAPKKQAPTILLSAGIHGDEPAGVHALVSFISMHCQKWQDRCNFLVLPCLNPSGYELGGRRSGLCDEDINRAFFPQSNIAEAAAVMDYLRRSGLQFTLAIDLHETRPDFQGEGWTTEDNPRAFYLYEHSTDRKQTLGTKLLDHVRPLMPICDWPSLYGDVNSQGVIQYPDGMQNKVYSKGTTFDAFLNTHNFTKHSVVLETPTGYSLDLRISVLLTAIEFCLNDKLACYGQYF